MIRKGPAGRDTSQVGARVIGQPAPAVAEEEYQQESGPGRPDVYYAHINSMKSPDWAGKKGKKGKRGPKPLKSVLSDPAYLQIPVTIPTYANIEAAPSMLPTKKYCDLTGLEAKYTEPSTKLRYHSAVEFAAIRALPDMTVKEYLSVRGAAPTLKM